MLPGVPHGPPPPPAPVAAGAAPAAAGQQPGFSALAHCFELQDINAQQQHVLTEQLRLLSGQQQPATPQQPQQLAIQQNQLLAQTQQLVAQLIQHLSQQQAAPQAAAAHEHPAAAPPLPLPQQQHAVGQLPPQPQQDDEVEEGEEEEEEGGEEEAAGAAAAGGEGGATLSCILTTANLPDVRDMLLMEGMPKEAQRAAIAVYKSGIMEHANSAAFAALQFASATLLLEGVPQDLCPVMTPVRKTPTQARRVAAPSTALSSNTSFKMARKVAPGGDSAELKARLPAAARFLASLSGAAVGSGQVAAGCVALVEFVGGQRIKLVWGADGAVTAEAA